MIDNVVAAGIKAEEAAQIHAAVHVNNDHEIRYTLNEVLD
jgi:hypothetical protein